jgi:hypothetical protein
MTLSGCWLLLGAVDADHGFFGQGEDQGDRIDLVDDHQAIGIGRVHDIARIDQARTDAAGEWRIDGGVAQLHLA